MSKKNSLSKTVFTLIFISLFATGCALRKKNEALANGTASTNSLANSVNEETLILLSTDSGDIKIRLYNATPLHRDNFIKLAEQHFYDSLLFHRVINNFMIQAGDPDSKNAPPNKNLGDGDLKYTIPAEFNPALFHKKGSLCAARQSDDINPQKASSGCQFYLVQGRKLSDNDLTQFEFRLNRSIINQISTELFKNPVNEQMRQDLNKYKQEGKQDSVQVLTKRLDDLFLVEYKKTPHYEFTEAQKTAYKTIGGTPHLDGAYTVFGEVYEGLEVIDKIANVATGMNDRPIKDVRIKKVMVIKNIPKKKNK